MKLFEIVVTDSTTRRACAVDLEVPDNLDPMEFARFIKAFFTKFINRGEELFTKSVK